MFNLNQQDTDFLITFMIVWALIGAVVSPFIFSRKKQNPFLGFVLGAVLGILGGILLLGPLWIFYPAKRKKCPQCAEMVQLEALVCKHCAYSFGSVSAHEEQKLIDKTLKLGLKRIGIGFAILLIPVFCFYLLMFVLIGITTIEGPSMLPRYQDGQLVVFLRTQSGINRGDIIVFQSLNPLEAEHGVNIVKRVVGLPQDLVEFRNNEVYINGQYLEEQYIAETCSVGCNDASWILGTNEYFVLGDNRNHSSDSRSFGPILSNSILGKLTFP